MIAQGCDPVLTGLFTPLRPHMGRYEVCTREKSIDEVIAEGGGFHYAEPEDLEPLEAFGSDGAYDRFALARLYGGRRVRVVRGWRQTDRQFESITLLSPHPDASLKKLLDGTMTIVLTIDRSSSSS